MSTQRIAAILLMTAGFAWTAGNFAQAGGPVSVQVITTLIHALPVALTILCAVPLLRQRDGGPRWATRLLSTLAALYTAGLLVIIAYSVGHPDPNAYGIHTAADAEPAALMAMGNLLWLASMMPARTRQTTAQRRAA